MPVGTLVELPPQPAISRVRSKTGDSMAKMASGRGERMVFGRRLRIRLMNITSGIMMPKSSCGIGPPRLEVDLPLATPLMPVSTVRVAVVEFAPTTGLLTEQETETEEQLMLTAFPPFPVMVSMTVPLCPEASVRLVGLASMVRAGFTASVNDVDVLPGNVPSPL